MEHFKKHPLYRFRWLIFVLPYFLALAGYIQLYFIEDHFNDVNTKFLKLSRNFNFLNSIELATRHLLAIAQRSVEDKQSVIVHCLFQIEN